MIGVGLVLILIKHQLGIHHRIGAVRFLIYQLFTTWFTLYSNIVSNEFKKSLESSTFFYTASVICSAAFLWNLSTCALFRSQSFSF